MNGITETLLTTEGRDGRNYAIVVLDDGSLALACDGEVMLGASWRRDKLDEAMKELVHVADLGR
jgi:hypothetical protein